MYAYTDTSFRAIRDPADALPGETVADTLPQSLLDSLAAAETQRTTTSSAIRQQADAALADLRAYRDLASPTNAQTVAVIKLLCRVCIGLIRLNLSKLDSAE